MADIGHNVSKLKEEIRKAISSVNELKKDREDTNAEMQAIREKLNALGIPKKAFDMALAYVNLDPDKREGFDIAYALVREVAGLPLQDDLFAAAERKANEEVPVDGKAKAPDAAGMDKVIQSQENAKVAGKKVHEPAGEHKGSIN